MMIKKRQTLTLMTLITAFAAVVLFSFFSTPQVVDGQVLYLTPTPDERGRVIYVVKENDTCISIALRNSISLDDLRLLNDLSGDSCTVYPGQELLLDVVEEATQIPVTVTPTSLFPTPTPFAGYVTICIRLFEDLNGDAVRQEAEILLQGGAASITDPLALQSWTGETIYNEELCFEELPAGEYNISIAVPPNYNSTTASALQVNVTPGDTALVNFGAQPSGQIIGDEVVGGNGETNQKSPLLGILGGLMLIGGGGLGIYMYVTSRRRENDF